MTQEHDGRRPLSPLEVWESINDPHVRWADVPHGRVLAQQLMANPGNAYLRRLFRLRLNHQAQKAAAARDPVLAHYPPRGSLPAVTAGRIGLAHLPTGDVLSVTVDALTRHLLLVGSSGSGKTTALRWILCSLLEACKRERLTCIAFNPKGDLVLESHTLSQAGLPVLVLDWTELKLAPLQCPPRIRLDDFINSTIDFLAGHSGLIASRRLMLETLVLLFREHERRGTKPTLTAWLDRLEKIRGGSRLDFYKEGVIYALLQIAFAFGSVMDYSESTMMQQICNFNGLVVIQTDGLDPDNASFLAGLFAHFAYNSRASYLDDVHVDHHPIFLCLDDAMRLVQTRMSEGGEELIDPISGFVLLARSRRIGFIVAAQNFSSISPTLRNNTSNLVVGGSYGRDAEELARFMNLNNDQAALLPVLQPGEVIAICRSVHPYAVWGRVPFIR